MKKLEDMTKEELVDLVKQLKGRKKYGLVWEDKSEDVVEQCKKELPVLDEVTEKAIEDDANGPTNILIEGDNYHALSVLNYTHAGKIDAIYIDPPYNTGAKDWTYNNHYIDSEDPYRHTKWISLMEHRIKISKNLLTPNGIVCVTIDDYEMPRLLLLMEEIFGEKNHLGTVVIKNNPSGRSTAKGFSIAHEYALFFAKSEQSEIGRIGRTEEQIARYKEKDEVGHFEWVNFRKHGGTRTEAPKMFYPIYITKNSIRIPSTEWDAKRIEWKILEKPKKSETIIYPVDDTGLERRWKWSIERARKELSEMKVSPDRNKELAVYIKSRLNDKGMLPLTWWDKKEYSATSHGTNLLKKMFSEHGVFSYPKSIYAVIDCLRVMSTKKDAIILDFFAGSGTTGHAVLELNKEDNGNRQFIICTNNENGIAENTTYPRINKVIKGYNGAAGIPANLRYFKTGFVKKSNVSDDTRKELVRKSTDMICVKEGTYKKIYDNKKYKLYKNQNQLTAILFDLDAIEEMKERINDQKMPANIYVFSLTSDTYNADFEGLEVQHTLCPIPESILEVYRKLVT